MPSSFDNLPFQVTATFIDVTSATNDDYGMPITNTFLGTETEATISGFFQYNIARGVTRAAVIQADEGLLRDYDVMFYAKASSARPSGENDIFLFAGIRYRFRNINPVFSTGTAIDHMEYMLEREEGVD